MAEYEDTRGQFLLLYASQTGQAKAIAEEFNDIALSEGLEPQLHCVSLVDKKFSLEKAKVAVIVASTTGDGEPPETAIKLYRRIKRTTLPDNHLAHLSFSLLGLGDTNYNTFCNFGKSVNRRLLELGAKQFYPSDWADDATGLEIVTEPWIDGCVVALKQFFGISSDLTSNSKSQPQTSSEIIPTRIKENSAAPLTTNGALSNINFPTEKQTSETEKEQNKLNVDISLGKLGTEEKVSIEASASQSLSNSKISEQGTFQSNTTIEKSSEFYSDIQESNSINDKDNSHLEFLDVSLSGSVDLKDNKSNSESNTNRTSLGATDTNKKSIGEADAKVVVTLSDTVDKLPVLDNFSSSVSEGTGSTQLNDKSEINSKEIKDDNKANFDLNILNETEIMQSASKKLDNENAVEKTLLQLESISLTDVTESLTNSLPPLSTSSLTLPLATSRFLHVKYHPGQLTQDLDKIQNNCSFAGSVSQTKSVPVRRARALTRRDAVKTALEIELDISECDWTYQPGDTIGVACENDDDDVEYIVSRLGLTDVAQVCCSVEVLETTTKKNATVPEYIPPKNATLFYILKTCIELRHVPRKVLLRCLADVTTDAAEKRRLQELSSKQGADHYTRYVREPTVTIIDVLSAFQSCKPSIELLLEHLPRLLPRPYSIASSALCSPTRLNFVFNIIEIPEGQGRKAYRQGVCTGLLNRLTKGLQTRAVLENIVEEKPVDTGSDQLYSFPAIPIFIRRNLYFHLPESLSTPIVMIGPGTGVAPFIGFLEHRRELHRQAKAADGEFIYGTTWLFYGCRHHERDFLYREELNGFVEDGTLTRLYVCFSRDEHTLGDQELYVREAAKQKHLETSGFPEYSGAGDSPDIIDATLNSSLAKQKLVSPNSSPRHVQDMMKIYGAELSTLVHGQNAVIYICGDARGMAPQVLTTIRQLLMTHKGFDEASADAYILKMRLDKRYLEDVWT